MLSIEGKKERAAWERGIGETGEKKHLEEKLKKVLEEGKERDEPHVSGSGGKEGGNWEESFDY